MVNLKTGNLDDRRGARSGDPAVASAEPFTFDRLLGGSDSLRGAIDAARMVAGARRSTVLLVGETGTGKELFARAIHCEGPTASAPFVAVNCAAIPESLLESELFGHEAGAFTGAVARKLGLMELAGCGTLFLDEIHHLPPQLQPKLLRALEERRIRRLSGSTEIEVECRIIAATNVAIDATIADGSFREDLFYRLNVLRVDIPPLRERLDDIELLASHFLREVARAHGTPAKKLAPDGAQALRAHDWPGNVRELRNVLERAAVLSGAGPAIGAAHLLIQQRSTRSADERARRGGTCHIDIPMEGKSLAAIEREAALLTLQLVNGNRTHAARVLGISRPTLARILRESDAAEPKPHSSATPRDGPAPE